MVQFDTDVLIIGAGPTGLTAALALARRGVSFRLIERELAISPYSKAFVLHARSLETLDLVSAGLAENCIQHGYTAPGFDFGSHTQRPIRTEMSGLDTWFPYLLVLPQAHIERLFVEQLQAVGANVERGKTLLHFSQDTAGVRCLVEHTSGQREEITARYLIGCDGAHSTVRHQLGLPFEGRGYAWTAFLGDVRIEGKLPRTGIFQVSSPHGLAIIQPFQEDQYYRVVILDANYQHEPPTNRALSLDELQASSDAIIPTRPRLKEPRWLTRWGAQVRQVPRYRVKHVFIAGDAAHIHSPAGGQGMNTGIQDAFNLAWKIALVLQGRVSEALLDSYQSERHPVGAHVLRLSNNVLRSVQVQHPLLRAGRDLAFRVLLPLPPVRQALSENLSGLNVNYRHAERANGMRQRDLEQPLGPDALRAGDRIPDMELLQLPVSVEQEQVTTSVRLYELLRYSGYTLLLATSADRFRQEEVQITRLLRTLKDVIGTTIDLYLVLDQGNLNETRQPGTAVLIDFKQQLRLKTGMQHGSLLLVRPDGYVAFHRLGFDPEKAVIALASLALPAQTQHTIHTL